MERSTIRLQLTTQAEGPATSRSGRSIVQHVQSLWCKTDMNENEFLRLADVTKRFGDVAVLRDINLSVASNEFLTILGPSGSGKTTILRLIGGFEQPSSGRIFIDGNDITNMPINQRPCNTVFQDYALFPHLSVRNNVGYGLMVRRTPAHVIEKKVKDVLEIVGLEPYTSRLPHELSGGQRQRVALARAIVCEPRVILLDEPLAALDVTLRAQMCAFLKGLQQRLHIAFIFITHDQQEAIAMSDRIVVMDAGRIKQIGTPKQLYHEPNSRFVAEFFGENNILEGTLVSAEGAVCVVETGFGIIVGRQAGEAATPGEKVHIAIRPENIRLVKDGITGHRFIVRNLQFAGSSNVVDVVEQSANQSALRVRLSGGNLVRMPQPSENVGLDWAAESVNVMRAQDDSDH